MSRARRALVARHRPDRGRCDARVPHRGPGAPHPRRLRLRRLLRGAGRGGLLRGLGPLLHARRAARGAHRRHPRDAARAALTAARLRGHGGVRPLHGEPAAAAPGRRRRQRDRRARRERTAQARGGHPPAGRWPSARSSPAPRSGRCSPGCRCPPWPSRSAGAGRSSWRPCWLWARPPCAPRWRESPHAAERPRPPAGLTSVHALALAAALASAAGVGFVVLPGALRGAQRNLRGRGRPAARRL